MSAELHPPQRHCLTRTHDRLAERHEDLEPIGPVAEFLVWDALRVGDKKEGK